MKNKFKVLIVFILFCTSIFAKEGMASYYHDKFHGRMTASGTIFNQNKMTCAHKTLPFGTKLLVTNLSNNKKIEVIVTDRGPFIEGRHVDLSRAAAEHIEMVDKGVQRVDFKIIGKPIEKMTAYNKPRPKDTTCYIYREKKKSIDIPIEIDFNKG